MVLLRGSNTARMRLRPPMRRRRPSSVVRIAVGAGEVVVDDDLAAVAGDAAAHLHSASIAFEPRQGGGRALGGTPTFGGGDRGQRVELLSMPLSPQVTLATAALAQHLKCSLAGGGEYGKRRSCSSLQQPWAMTRCRLSSAFTTTRPLAGTVRTR